MNPIRPLETDLHLSMCLRETLKAMELLGRELRDQSAAERVSEQMKKAYEALDLAVDSLKVRMEEISNESK